MSALHAFTGADCTSAFKGKGKLKLMKLLRQNYTFIHLFAAVGFTWTLDDEHIAMASRNLRVACVGLDRE